MAHSTKTRNVLQTKISSNSLKETGNQTSKVKTNIKTGPRSLASAQNISKAKALGDPVVVARKKREPALSGQQQRRVKPQIRGPNMTSSTLSKSLQAMPQVREKKEGGLLLGRQASTTGTNVSLKEQIQSRLKKKSPWFDSIMDPVGGGGVKIPDPIGTDTGTYQHVENVSVPVNAQGISGLRIISPYINDYVNGADDGSNYQTTISSSIVSQLNWGGTSGIVTNTFAFKGIPSIMKSNSKQHRVVSCSVVAQPEISTLADAGEICAFVTPFGCNDATVTYAALQYQWDSSLMPVNVHKPVIARWYPLESQFNLFNGRDSITPDDGSINTISYRDFINPDPDEGTNGVVPWEVGVVCTGMTPSQGIVRYQICVNYEFIPISSTAMVTTEPSPIDPMEEQLVASWVSDCPITSVVSQKQASKAPTGSSVPEEQTGFGMFADVVKEIIPLAGKVLPFFL
jgi:hypothetical protein